MSEFLITAETTISRNNEPLQADVDGEIVMASLEQGNYYGLGNVGSRIWELLEQPVTQADLIAQLMEEYEIDQSTCEAETLKFLQDLQTNNLISVNG